MNDLHSYADLDEFRVDHESLVDMILVQPPSFTLMSALSAEEVIYNV